MPHTFATDTGPCPLLEGSHTAWGTWLSLGWGLCLGTRPQPLGAHYLKMAARHISWDVTGDQRGDCPQAGPQHRVPDATTLCPVPQPEEDGATTRLLSLRWGRPSAGLASYGPGGDFSVTRAPGQGSHFMKGRHGDGRRWGFLEEREKPPAWKPLCS